MTSPLYGTGPTDLTASRPLPARSAVAPSVARTTLVTAALLGAAADALIPDGPMGAGLALWVAIFAINAVALFRRAGRDPSREALLWLAAALTFSLGLAWRNSDALQGLDFLAMLFSLAMAAVSVRDPRAALFARRLIHTLRTGLDVAGNTVAGVLPLAFRDAILNEAGVDTFARARRLVRPALIALAALVVFGSLLRNADPIFASLVNLPSIDLSDIMRHVVLAGFFAWIVAGWARASLVDNPTRHRSTGALPIQLDGADITAALGTLAVLFTAFVATQIGWLFGGEKFLQARTGLTAAAYARQGFFQMVWVVTLVIPILVGTRAALGPGRGLARRHTLLSLPVVVLLAAIVGSAMLRMRMYVHYYGLTTERFYPAVFMLWLATVLVWLAVTVLRDWGRPFLGGAVMSALAFLFALNIADPDGIVARVNVSRAQGVSAGAEPSLDLVHLASLHGAGVGIAADAILRSDVGAAPASVPNSPAARRCQAARALLSQWSASSGRRRFVRAGGWRRWNHDDAVAFQVVGSRRAELQVLADGGCSSATPEH